jgi:hypothetical protein
LNAALIEQLPVVGVADSRAAMRVQMTWEITPKCLKQKDFSPN